MKLKGMQIATASLAIVALMAPSSAGAALTVGALSVTSDGALSMEAAAGSDIVLGSAAVAGALTLGGTGQTGTIGLGAGTAAQTINIGTGAAVVKTISVGGTGANVIAIGNTQTGGSVAIGAAMTTGTITIGGAAQAGIITLGQNSSGAGIVNVGSGNLASGSATVNIANGAQAVGTTTAVNIANNTLGSGNTTVNISNAAALAGTRIVNIVASQGVPSTDVINIGHATSNTIVTGFLEIPSGTATPAAGDCDNASEAGRVYVETDAAIMWICTGAAWADASP